MLALFLNTLLRRRGEVVTGEDTTDDLLLEDGSFLLLESGDKVLLEA